MKAIMITYDSLNRKYLPNYGCDWVKAPNFERLGEIATTFDKNYCGSLPCMPARREFHTGRYNFLHRSWGPIEPFDDSMPAILQRNGIYSHLVSDHNHYWEDGGATYHTRYSTWNCSRGQEGDPWKPLVNPPAMPDHIGSFWKQDWVNRQFIKELTDMPQTKTFNGGIEFLDLNHEADDWFLHIETFDPHEPFYTMPEFREIYEKVYDGPHFDWPTYDAVTDEERPFIEHIHKIYAALVTMCDLSLGKIMNKMDEYDLWKDTLLIINTDHGFLLGEHDYWAKSNVVNMYEEVAHTPFFIYDPVSRARGRNEALTQTIDIPATILDYFNISKPKDMLGISLLPSMREGKAVHQEILYGVHGAHITCTDGHYKYILSPKKSNWPLYNYTVMPTHMRSLFAPEEFEGTTLAEPFQFSKGIHLMKIPDRTYIGGNIPKTYMKEIPDDLLKVLPHQDRPDEWVTLLFNLDEDPKEESPIHDFEVEKRFRYAMVNLMIENDAPIEQYERMGLEVEYENLKSS